MTKKFIWKAAATGVVLAGIVLGGFAVLGWMHRRSGSILENHGPGIPAVKPEQGIILFQSRVEGGLWQIFSLDLSTGARIRLTQSSADDYYPSASPDGSWIVFESTRDGSKAVWRMRADDRYPDWAPGKDNR